MGLEASQGGWRPHEKGGRAEAVWGRQRVHHVQLVGSFPLSPGSLKTRRNRENKQVLWRHLSQRQGFKFTL